jgi:hypothetical protein
VVQHSEIDWNWSELSRILPWDIILQHPDKPWDWENISRNPNVATWEVVQQYPDKPWNWYQLSFHIDAPLDVLLQKLNNNWIMNHSVAYNKRTALREKYLQTHLAKRAAELFIKSDLKRELMEKLWHPRNMEKWPGWGFEEEENID